MTNVITFAPKTITTPVGHRANTKAASMAEVYTHDVGAKYAATEGLDIKAVAVLVRADIKAAIKVGQLPAGTYAVKISRYSMGQSLSVRAAVPGMVVRCPERRAAFDIDPDSVRTLFTDQAEGVRDMLEAIVAAYNRTDSHAQSDYCNSRFYGFVSLT
jgi:hypothetical protein